MGKHGGYRQEALDIYLANRWLPSFCQTNKLEKICRAHQLVMEGYKHMFDDTVVTVWSAPNYCYRCGNQAAIMELDKDLNSSFTLFTAAPDEVRGVPEKKPPPEYFL